MKKRLPVIIISSVIGVVALTLAVILLIPKEPTQLEAPVVQLIEDKAIWEANELADKFEISVSGTLYNLENTVTSYNLQDGQTFKIRAIGDGVVYKTSKWSNLVEYNEESTQNAYTVIWMNGSEILEKDENVVYGSTPSYDGDEPIKESTAQYTYMFSGWSPSITVVTENIAYYAQFSEQLVYYTVKFYDFDKSTLLKEEKVAYGASATPPETEEKEDLILVGWEGDWTNVTENISVYAIYSEACTVKFFMPDGKTQLGETQIIGKYESAKEPEYPEYYEVKEDEGLETQRTYLKAFSGWSENFSTITKDVNIIAKYERNTGVVILVKAHYVDSKEFRLDFYIYSDYKIYDESTETYINKKIYALEMLLSYETPTETEIYFNSYASEGVFDITGSNETKDQLNCVLNNNEKTFDLAWLNSRGENISELSGILTVKCSTNNSIGINAGFIVNNLEKVKCNAVIDDDDGEMETVEVSVVFIVE